MRETSPTAKRLKQLRVRSQLSIRDVANALGWEYGSSYQHYEDRYKKPFLPVELVMKLVPIFTAKGIPSEDVLDLAGFNSKAARALVAVPESDYAVKIAEIDLRTVKNLTKTAGETAAVWMIPKAVLQSFTSAPASDLKIIAVVGDAMDRTLLPGDRILVDAGDRIPTPPGIFIVHDGQGLVIKRVLFLPKHDPPKVKVTCDNTKYGSYECSIEEANIQGRVIGRWQRL